MKGLVWALFLMVQEPGAGVSADARSLAFTGVTYLNRNSCANDANTFRQMDMADKADGVDSDLSVDYVCILQPKPGHYKG